MYDWDGCTGWACYNTFGLRKEWLEAYFRDPSGWRNKSMLGNRQVDSFSKWLSTCGIEDHSEEATLLGQLFAEKGTSNIPLWEALWINVVFKFPTARWYVILGSSEFSTTDLKNKLKQAVPRLSDRTVSNAIKELAGLLERTPIGKDLRQGVITKTKPRIYHRENHNPSFFAIMYAIGSLLGDMRCSQLFWEQDLTWPWMIFGCSKEYVFEQLAITDQNYLNVNQSEIRSCITGKEWWQCGNIMNTFL